MSEQKRKRVVPTIQQKLDILKQLEQGTSAKFLANMYNIGVNTVHDVRRKKDQLLKFSLISADSIFGIQNRKTMKKSSHDLLDRALLQWFNSKRSAGRPITGPMCAKEAKILFKTLGLEGHFDASSGWLTRFKDRHGIRTIGNSMNCIWTTSSENCQVLQGKSAETPKMDDSPPVVESSELKVSAVEDDFNFKFQKKTNQQLVVENKKKKVDEHKHSYTITSKEDKLMETNTEKVTVKENNIEQDVSDLTNLKSVVKKLEAISEKLAVNIFDDSFDEFGKYISSLLRRIPEKEVLVLKQKLVSDVLDILLAHERGVSNDCLPITSTSKQRNNKVSSNNPMPCRNVQTSASNLLSQSFPVVPCQSFSASSPFTSTATQQSYLIQGNTVMSSTSLQPSQKQINHHPKLGRNVPVLVPGTTNSNSTFTLLPVIPMNGPVSATNKSPLMTTAVGCMDSIDSSQQTQCESIRTLSSTPDGTLIAVTLPARGPIGTSNAPANKTSTVIAPRGRKRKQKTSAYLIKRMPGTNSSTMTELKVVENDEISEDSKAESDSEITPSEVEFDIKIEEGQELKHIKEDSELFETIICDEITMYKVKEEVTDVEDRLEEYGNSRTSYEETLASTSPHVFICDLCSDNFTTREEIIEHFKQNHSGCVPTCEVQQDSL